MLYRVDENHLGGYHLQCFWGWLRGDKLQWPWTWPWGWSAALRRSLVSIISERLGENGIVFYLSTLSDPDGSILTFLYIIRWFHSFIHSHLFQKVWCNFFCLFCQNYFKMKNADSDKRGNPKPFWKGYVSFEAVRGLGASVFPALWRDWEGALCFLVPAWRIPASLNSQHWVWKAIVLDRTLGSSQTVYLLVSVSLQAPFSRTFKL